MDSPEKSSDIVTVKEIPHVTSMHSICPILVGIAGGSASGKTTLCNTIISEIGLKDCLVITLDSFYKPLTPEEAIDFNFDHPDAYDFDLCYEVIRKLLTRQPAEIPIYNYITNTREIETTRVEPCDLILLEGILALYHAKLVDLMNVKLFVDCDNDIRLYRRMLRDIKERGRDVKGILYQYNKFVKPAFDELIKPTMNQAHLIIPGRSRNKVAIKFIVENLRLQLTRLKEMKEDMNNNAFYADVLDSCWLNIDNGDDEESKGLSVYQSDRILFLRDSQAKADCLLSLKMLSNTFTESLYMTLMVKFLGYGIALMRASYSFIKPKEIRILHYLEIANEKRKNVEECKSVGIIAPFLHKGTLVSLQEKIDSLLEKKSGTKVFVMSIFADLETIANLCRWKKNIYLVNILYIVNMKALFASLEENCETKKFDFCSDKVLVQLMLDTSYTELLKEEIIAG